MAIQTATTTAAAVNTARRQPGGSSKDRRGRTASAGAAQTMKRARWALWKNPENLTDRQRHKLAWIAKTDPRLYRELRFIATPRGHRSLTR